MVSLSSHSVKRMDDLLDEVQAANIKWRALHGELSKPLIQLNVEHAENIWLKEELKLSRKNLYGQKSQRWCSVKKKGSVFRDKFKDGFDDTSGYLLCLRRNHHRQAKLNRLWQ